MKCYNGKINSNFYNNRIPKDGSQCNYLSVILIDSVFRIESNFLMMYYGNNLFFLLIRYEIIFWVFISWISPWNMGKNYNGGIFYENKSFCDRFFLWSFFCLFQNGPWITTCRLTPHWQIGQKLQLNLIFYFRDYFLLNIMFYAESSLRAKLYFFYMMICVL